MDVVMLSEEYDGFQRLREVLLDGWVAQYQSKTVSDHWYLCSTNVYKTEGGAEEEALSFLKITDHALKTRTRNVEAVMLLLINENGLQDE